MGNESHTLVNAVAVYRKHDPQAGCLDWRKRTLSKELGKVGP